jgi:hypothetical protein
MMILLPFLFKDHINSLSSALRQEEEIEGIWIRKEDIKPYHSQTI